MCDCGKWEVASRRTQSKTKREFQVVICSDCVQKILPKKSGDPLSKAALAKIGWNKPKITQYWRC